MTISASDLSLLSELLDAALELDPAGVESWLSALPPAQRHLAPRLRDMLAEARSTQGGAFLRDSPHLEAADEAVAHPGDRVGPYRLLREIGRGGMGSVWLAERADGSFQRLVAIKLPRLSWGAGLAERMAREREIGARLEHPAIARLYDAGVDERGRPYLALEYIDGQPVDAWCEARALPVRDRLRLCVQIARAVSYAHGRLVVHRDLKPSNVLVGADGQAHLLDFGIAKLLQEATDNAPGLTQEQGRVLTPQYASPEQIAGEAVTVQSDVYSLGVLMYELLTGQLPHAPRRATLGAVEDAILEGDARPASSRTSDKAVARALRGEVDAILDKAMQRDPARRYATVDALTQDIERHLNGETVLARPAGRLYRWRKAARRHWVVLTAASAVMVAVLSGSGVALVQAQRANAEAERARLVNEFVVAMFDTHAGSEGSLAQIPAQALLERGARQIDSKFAGQPLLQAQLYGVVSQMYFNLSAFEKAVDFGTRQVEALSSAGERGRPLAVATLSLGESLIDLWRWGDAEVRLRRAIALAADDPDLLVRAHAQLAFVLAAGQGHIDAGGQELDAAEALMARHAVPALARANVLFVRGLWLSDGKGQIDKSIPLFDEAIRLAIEAEGPTSRTAMHARTTLGAQLTFAYRSEQAKPYVDAALAAMRSVGGPDDARAAVEESRFASWMYSFDGTRRFADVVATVARDRAALQSRSWTVPAHVLAEMDLHLGVVYMRWGDYVQGRALMTRAFPICMEHAERGLARNMCLGHAVVAATWAGAHTEADEISNRIMSENKALYTGNDLAWAYDQRAIFLMHERRYDDAQAVLDEFDALPGVAQARDAGSATQDHDWDEARLVVALERGRFDDVLAMTERRHLKADQRYDDGAFVARASALCGRNRFDEGLALFAQSLPRLARDRSDANPLVAYWRARMGLCALAAGHARLAREASAMASAAIAGQSAVSAHLLAPVAQLKARLAGAKLASL